MRDLGRRVRTHPADPDPGPQRHPVHHPAPSQIVRPRTVPLHSALPPTRFVVQPIVHLGTGQVTAMEVLARPDDGHSVGTWTPLELAHRSKALLHGALAHAARTPHRPGVLVHVNVTAVDLARPTLPAEVRDHLRGRRDHLVLELTEQLELRDTPTTWRNLRALRRAGVRFALDDFGEGWSTTLALRRLQPELLKVTMAGLSSERGWDDNLATWVRQRATSAGCTQIVVEYIEDPECAAWVKGHGFSHAQGHAIDRLVRARAARIERERRPARPHLVLLRSA